MADYQYVLAVHVDAAKRGQKRRNAEEHFGKKLFVEILMQETCCSLHYDVFDLYMAR